MQNYRLPIVIGLSLIAIIAVLLLSGESERLLGRLPYAEEPTLPSAVANNPRTQHFDENGQLSYSFKADKLLYFDPKSTSSSDILDPSYTLIENPKITVYDDQSPWLIEAEKGHVNSDNSVIKLSQSVLIHRTTISGAKIELRTEELSIEITEKRAITDKPVTIHTDSGSMSAIGMQADFDSKKIQLLSQVRGVHKPKK